MEARDVRELAKEIKGERTMNRRSLRRAVQSKDYPKAAHLAAVNEGLGYVLHRLNKLVKDGVEKAKA